MKPILALLVLFSLAAPTQAQLRDNRDTQLACNNINRDRPNSCEIRESTLGPSGQLNIEPSNNGGLSIKGWAQNSVLVRARVEAWAESDGEAQALASQIRVEVAGGRIQATGPDLDRFFGFNQGRHWAVSFEVFAPWNTNLRLDSHNGAITVSDIRGEINFQSHNGGVRLIRVAGDVNGETHNGAIEVELNGATWEGRQLELSTHNGGVTLSMPPSYSARLETRSNHGRLASDFPVTVNGRISERELNFNVGSGGPLIKVSTQNGGIRLRKM
jgi:hypothetical protein